MLQCHFVLFCFPVGLVPTLAEDGQNGFHFVSFVAYHLHSRLVYHLGDPSLSSSAFLITADYRRLMQLN